MKIKRHLTLLAVVTIGFSLLLFAQKTPVDPVNWKELVPYLIDIPGWEAEGEPSGQSMSMGDFKISQAECSYVSGEKNLKIEIVDGGYVPMVYAGIKMAMNFEIDTSEEYIRKTTVKGFPAVEQYEYEGRLAKIMILAAERFLVNLEEENADDSSEVKAVAETLDLEGLADLIE